MDVKNVEILKKIIACYKSAVIAFSGGVDSTFLAGVAGDVLKKRVLLVTASPSTYPGFEIEEAKKMAEFIHLNHLVIKLEEINIPQFSDNPPDRCYYCKKELFTQIKNLAAREGYDVVFDGSNADASFFIYI